MKKTIFTIAILVISLVSFSSCQEQKKKTTETQINEQTEGEEQKYRPHYHFTPQKNWMNDPNGMFYLDGVYHLYFQYYPEDNVWGPMHWGSATSTDLVHFKEEKIALYPDSLGYIFSGSAVVDVNNTSGFGKNGITPIVAIYTYHEPKGEEQGRIDYQSQAIAYSLNKGLSWIKYKNNPVIKNPQIKNFRDPKVFWDKIKNQWVMSLAAGDKIMFYGSPNLIDWKYLSSFGQQIGSHKGVWECPDLFPLTVEGSNEIKWILLVSINPGGFNGGSATQYFIGDFNGTHFTIDSNFEQQVKESKYDAIWIDGGRDNYAGVTWSNVPENDGRRIFMGWMSNWDYGQIVPTKTWRSAMTIPRTLHLIKTEKKHYFLSSQPVKELEQFLTLKQNIEAITIKSKDIILTSVELNLRKAKILFNVENIKDLKKCTFTLSNKKGNIYEFGYNTEKNEFFTNRSKTQKNTFSDKYASHQTVIPRISDSNQLKVSLFLDKTSIEIFYDDGLTVMTEIFFPESPFDQLSVSNPKGKDIIIKNLKSFEITN